MKFALPPHTEHAPPRAPGEKSIPYWEMLFRETIAIEMLAVVLVCLALLWNAPPTVASNFLSQYPADLCIQTILL